MACTLSAHSDCAKILEGLASQDGRKFKDKYEFCCPLGRGTYGDVWSCKTACTECGEDPATTAVEEFACKLIQKEKLRAKEERESLRKEVQILQSLRDSGIVRLREAVESTVVVYLVMELCKGGDLFTLIRKKGRLPELAAKGLFRQVASALALCHSKGIIHRDIKPENILLDVPGDCLYSQSGDTEAPLVRAVLADFGLAEVLPPGETCSGFMGSRHYIAPEVLQGKRYGRKVDVWSLGVVLHVMLTGKVPWKGSDAELVKRCLGSEARLLQTRVAWCVVGGKGFGPSDAPGGAPEEDQGM